jgi:hypothetical protein
MEAKLEALLALAPDGKGRDSSVGIAMGYGLDGRGRIFSLVHSIHTGSGVHLSSYTVGTLNPGKSSRGVKLFIHLHLMSSLKMVELYLYSPIRLYGVVFN